MSKAIRVYHPPQKVSPPPFNPTELFTQLGLAEHGREEVTIKVRKGLPVKVIDNFAKELDVAKSVILKTVAVSSASYTRRSKSKSKLLTTAESDRIYRFANVYRAALQLFEGDREAARRWLEEPAKALGGNSPLEHIDTEAGADEVRDLIGRLEHGVIV